MAIQNKRQSMASRLIQGAGNVYGKSAQIQMQAANRPSYNPSAQNAINQSAGRANYMRKMQEYRNDQIVKGYINQIPDGFDTSQLPVAYRPVIKDKLTEFRKEAKDVITQYLSGTYDPAQDEYVEGLQKLDSIKQKIRVMEQGFKNFGSGKTEFLKDYSDKNFSSANNLENMSNLSNLFTDQIPMEINSETGNPTWAGKTYNEHMANQPFNKAYTEAGKYTNFAQKMYKAGVPMDDATKIMYGNELNLMLDKGGWEVTRSLVKDNILGDNFLKDQQPLVDQLIEQGNSQDPQAAYEAREQLNDLLKDRMLENLNTMALKGQEVNASKVKTSAPGQTGPLGNIDPATGQNDIDKWLSTFEQIEEGTGMSHLDPKYVEPPSADEWNIELMGTDFGIVSTPSDVTYNIKGSSYNEAQLLAQLLSKVGDTKYNEFLGMSDEEKGNYLADIFPGISDTQTGGGSYIQYLGGNADQRDARQFPVDLANPDKIAKLLKRLQKKIEK